jgi:Transcriptional activator of glycolytic enzymes
VKKSYKKTMRTALAEEKSPLDACLETVLPGVHQWHLANNQAINRLGDKMDNMAESVGNAIQSLINQVSRSEQIRSEQEQRLAALLEIGSNVLRNGGSASTGMSTATTYNDNTQMEFSNEQSTGSLDGSLSLQAVTVSEDEDDLERHKKYRMKPKHRSLTDLYAEWVGEGDFADEFGGIEGRNKRFGARWRKQLVPYIYSRTERTVKGIRAFAVQEDITVYDACERMQEHFVKCKYSVANLVGYFTSVGLLTKKKPRGKRNATNDHSL